MDLEDVMAVEREIARLADAEHSEADRWLAATKRDIDKNADDERARVLAEASRDDETAKMQASEKASPVVDDAKSVASRLDALDDDALRPFILKHLASLLPAASQ